MKKSINAWSVEDGTGFEEMFAQIKAAGFDGIELNVDNPGHSAHSLSMETTQEELVEIRAISEKHGLPVVSISSSLFGGSMGSPDPAQREFGKALVAKQLECAKALGAGGILTVPGGIGPEVSIQQAYDTCLETYGELRELALESGLKVGVENVWNGFFMSPRDMAGFLDRLDCPAIGAYYDVGNVIAFSWSEYWIQILGGRIQHIHVKDFKRNGGLNSGGAFVDLCKGDVNWKAVIPALKEAGFDGYLTAEVFLSDSDEKDLGYTGFYQAVSDAIGKIIAEN